MRLVLASNNAKKLIELQQLLAGLPVELVAQGRLGVAEADEPHATFIENALAKARHAAAATGGAAIADDSGLCVDALGGAPGVISAHYAGEVAPGREPERDPGREPGREAQRRAQDAANNARLLQALQGVAGRSAHFVCTLVALRSAQDPQPLVAVGRWPAEILCQPRGERGFGYDPLVYIPELDRAVAELDAATKNTHSHRARAMAQMRQLLREVWRL
ncbi:MAG: RdgB/HAM1 family non-canonical purine NTP pyrophosphatase [Burkholderiales bacterium]|nr:RdgB/HAM1 family non-canonical purine NTP pyrophosphatase [Burkholderiales bacterium]